MPSLLQPAHPQRIALPIERTLARYYPRFLEWSAILTRGNIAAAEEIVQDLCLHLVVVRPDLSGIRDLDAYLYTSLRNMYLSHMNRASRERLRVVHVEDYDAVEFAMMSNDPDEVDTQNELLRICLHVMKRKYVSKSASHFILHFFWGYHRSDVALIAGLPVAAIYNKLRDVRAELQAQRAARRVTLPAERDLLRSALTTDAFLAKLRSLLLDAKPAECLDEAKLAALYAKANKAPVPNKLLAHLAGCASCQSRLERLLRLEEKDGPLDDDRGGSMTQPQARRSFSETMQVVQRRQIQLLEERPVLLTLAVDGYVVASHAVDSPLSLLSARIARVDAAGFVEVFNERGSRMAALSVEEHMTQSMEQTIQQKVLLSDDRALQLVIHFEDQDMHAEATYVDLALADVGKAVASPSDEMRQDSLWSWLLTPFRIPVFRATMAAISIAIIVFVLHAIYRSAYPSTAQILARAATTQEQPSATEALYQTAHLELHTDPSAGSDAGTVVIWREADHRTVRQLYSAQHTLLATAVTRGGAPAVESRVPDAVVTPAEQQLLDSGAWASDLSANGFSNASSVQTSTGFELTTRGVGQHGVLSRTLVLDRGYRIVAQRVRFQTAHGISELVMVQTALRHVSRRDMPADEMPARQSLAPSTRNRSEIISGARPISVTANLEVAILYELYQLHADTALPLQMEPTEGGRILLSGTVPTKPMVTSIRNRVMALPHADAVDVHIGVSSDAALTRQTSHTQELLGTDAEPPAAPLVREALRKQGVASVGMQRAEEQFSAAALAHAQAALQHAYALERLGNILHLAGEGSLEPQSQSEWTAMVEHHSIAMNTELNALRRQLDALSSNPEQPPMRDDDPIEDIGQFYSTSSRIRDRVQRLNTHVMDLFGANSGRLTEVDVSAAIIEMGIDLPMNDVQRTMRFAAHLYGRQAASVTALE